MIRIKKCCWCFSPKTASVIIGSFGIILTISALVPHCVIIDNHEFYINEYIKQQRASGLREIHDEDIPKIELFSKITWSLAIAYDVVYIFSSILLISGVTAKKRFLMIPWLLLIITSILFNIILVLAIMFALSNYTSLVVFFCAVPFILFSLYLWLTVYSTFHQLRREEDGQTMDHEVGSCPEISNRESNLNPTQSNSNSSFASLKGNLQRVISGTPPPPYEAVAKDIDKEEEAIAAGIDANDLIFTSGDREQGPRVPTTYTA